MSGASKRTSGLANGPVLYAPISYKSGPMCRLIIEREKEQANSRVRVSERKSERARHGSQARRKTNIFHNYKDYDVTLSDPRITDRQTHRHTHRLQREVP